MRPWLIPVSCALLISASACGDLFAPNDPPLSGKWGMMCGVDTGCEFQLRQSGSAVSGEVGGRSPVGEFFSGNIITGTYDAPSVHLSWTENGISSTLDGTVLGDTEIVGSWHDGPVHVLQADLFKAR